MGKFDGILLASDWDGTLFYNGKLCEKDINSIKYFQENGGSFTLASGRSLPFIREFFYDIKPNTYCISLNGALIIHPDSEHVLYEGFIDHQVVQMLDMVFSARDYFAYMTVYFKHQTGALTFSPEDYLKERERFLTEEIYKILLVSDSEYKTLCAKSLLENIGYDGYMFVRSWDVSLEILAIKNGKGEALKRLAKHLGTRLTLAVGDFENDLQMIECADIGYAVGNATDIVKKTADRITVPAYDGAIAHIISEIDTSCDNKFTAKK